MDSRAKSLDHESVDGLDDPKAAARALLKESNERKEADPAPRDPAADTVIRRTSDEATPPPDSD